MYTTSVRHHIMIAHSLPHPFFGPAAGLHGATYVIDAKFTCEDLDEHNVVIDIGKAHQVLDEVAGALNYRNLDEYTPLHGKLTTTEFLARYIHDQIANHLDGTFRGGLEITLNESHIAAAGYSGPVG
jgi:6-pyruvoyltetrahydropterin/6-carboxytetrahydropterin synthase